MRVSTIATGANLPEGSLTITLHKSVDDRCFAEYCVDWNAASLLSVGSDEVIRSTQFVLSAAATPRQKS